MNISSPLLRHRTPTHGWLLPLHALATSTTTAVVDGWSRATFDAAQDGHPQQQPARAPGAAHLPSHDTGLHSRCPGKSRLTQACALSVCHSNLLFTYAFNVHFVYQLVFLLLFCCMCVLHPLLYCAGCCLILLALACAFNRLLNLAGLSMCIPHPQRKRTLIFFFNRPQYIHHCL